MFQESLTSRNVTDLVFQTYYSTGPAFIGTLDQNSISYFYLSETNFSGRSFFFASLADLILIHFNSIKQALLPATTTAHQISESLHGNSFISWLPMWSPMRCCFALRVQLARLCHLSMKLYPNPKQLPSIKEIIQSSLPIQETTSFGERTQLQVPFFSFHLFSLPKSIAK